MEAKTEFKQLRRRARLTQQETGDRLGVSRVSVGRWECGMAKVPQTALMAMRQVARERCDDSYTLPGRI